MCCVLGAAQAAEQGQLSTDRPDFLSAPDVVGKGRFQVELGAQVERDDSRGIRTRTVTTPTLLRFGVADTLELRLETEGHVRQRETLLATQVTDHERGWADTTLGIKWNSQKGTAGAPSIGWILEAELPSGSRAFRGRGIRPAVIGLAQLDLRGDMQISGNAGVKYDSDENGDRFTAALLGGGVRKTLTERFKVMGEVVAQQIARKKHGGNIVIADVAVAYLLTPSVQLDALIGRGLTSDSPKYVFTTGVSARF
jgi:hypothetical protein